MVSLNEFYSQKVPKMIGVKKKPPCQFGQVNLDLLVWLGNQYWPYHFD